VFQDYIQEDGDNNYFFAFSDVDERANLSNPLSQPILTRIEDFDQKQSLRINVPFILIFRQRMKGHFKYR
jgi:hypothetical protein